MSDNVIYWCESIEDKVTDNACVIDNYSIIKDGKKYNITLSKGEKEPVGFIHRFGIITQISSLPDHYEMPFEFTVSSYDNDNDKEETISFKARIELHNRGGKLMAGFNFENTYDREEANRLLRDFFITPLKRMSMPYGKNTVLQEYLISTASLSELKEMAQNITTPVIVSGRNNLGTKLFFYEMRNKERSI